MAYINNKDRTITDTTTNLMWQAVTPIESMSWQDARKYCKSLELAGYRDWRLPTIKELVSIVEYSRSYPALDSIFGGWSSPCWSSTIYHYNEDFAWIVEFHDGRIHNICKESDSISIRAVRSIRED